MSDDLNLPELEPLKPTHNQIALLAWTIWDDKGGGDTTPEVAEQNWLEAELFLMHEWRHKKRHEESE